MLLNSASGPEIGLPALILAGLLPENHPNRPSGRPRAGRRAYFRAFPAAVRPPARKADFRLGSAIAKHRVFTSEPHVS